MTARIDVDFINRVLAKDFVAEDANDLLNAIQERIKHLRDALDQLKLIELQILTLTKMVQNNTAVEKLAETSADAEAVLSEPQRSAFESILRDAINVAVSYQEGTLTADQSPVGALDNVKLLKLSDIPEHLEKFENHISDVFTYVRNVKNSRQRRIARIASLALILNEPTEVPKPEVEQSVPCKSDFETDLRESVDTAFRYCEGTLSDGKIVGDALNKIKALQLTDIPANLKKFEHQITFTVIYVRDVKNSRRRRLARIASLAPLLSEPTEVPKSESKPVLEDKNDSDEIVTVKKRATNFFNKIRNAVNIAFQYDHSSPREVTGRQHEALGKFVECCESQNLRDLPNQLSHLLPQIRETHAYLRNTRNSVDRRLRRLAELYSPLVSATVAANSRNKKIDRLLRGSYQISHHELVKFVEKNIELIDGGNNVYGPYLECLENYLKMDPRLWDISITRNALIGIYARAVRSALHESFCFYQDRIAITDVLRSAVNRLLTGWEPGLVLAELDNIDFARKSPIASHPILNVAAVTSLKIITDKKGSLVNRARRFLSDAAQGLYGSECMIAFGQGIYDLYSNATSIVTEKNESARRLIKHSMIPTSMVVLETCTSKAADALSDGLTKLHEEISWSDLPLLQSVDTRDAEFAVILT